jgi:hypothetical protein
MVATTLQPASTMVSIACSDDFGATPAVRAVTTVTDIPSFFASKAEAKTQ